MPLLDHFHPPLLNRRHWDAFHGRWATALSDALNAILPPEYFAEPQVTVGAGIEVDVATFDENEPRESDGSSSAGRVATRTWAPPTPVAVMPAVFPDEFGVRVFDSAEGPTLVAALELVSPRNKDRRASRRAFSAKCAAYLQRGIGLVVVDIVTSRRANLHDALMTMLGHTTGFTFEHATPIYATAYRPVHREERNEIDLWRETLTVGRPLPELPLWVRGLGCLPIDLEATYTEARERNRID